MSNFQNDNTHQFLDLFIGNLVKIVRTCMTSPMLTNQNLFYSNYGKGTLMPAIDLLVTVSKHYNYSLKWHMTLDEIDTWRDTYLQIYDGAITTYTTKTDYITDRRKVIEVTFAELRKLAQDL